MKNIFFVPIPVGGRYCILSIASNRPHITVKQKESVASKGIYCKISELKNPSSSAESKSWRATNFKDEREVKTLVTLWMVTQGTV